MILTENKGVVVTSDNVQSRGFSIKASRKAFEILSAGLYSDKVKAIVRELSTNAADSHVAAGKRDVPFEVHLPNTFEPWFSVKDFGTGLSDDAINTVYTTYFESDKSNSNDFTGCLGLGSKSPFSYTDSFTVSSRHGGVERVYTAFLDENGTPSLAKLSESPTDEPTGLTVSFPVKSCDFYDFKDRAEKVLRWFGTPPKVSGNKDFKMNEQLFLVKTEEFGVYRSSTYESVVVMGNVAYPISASELGLSSYSTTESELCHVVNWGVVLRVGIGEVDIAASREKLSYDKKTVAHVKALLRKAIEAMGVEVTKDIAAKPTLWAARRALHDVKKSFQGFKFEAVWGGNKVDDFVRVAKKKVTTEDNREIFVPVAKVEKLRNKGGEQRCLINQSACDGIEADGTKIVLADDKGALAAVRRLLKGSTYGTTIYFISSADPQWLADTGIDGVAVKSSSIPKPERVKGVRGSSQKAKLYKFVPSGNGMSGTASASFWEPAEVDPDEGGVYVEIQYFNFRLTEEEGTEQPKRIKELYQNLAALGREVEVYGIRPSDKAILDKSEGDWVGLRDYCLQTIDDFGHLADAKCRELESYNAHRYYGSRIDCREFAKANVGGVFGEYVKLVNDTEAVLKSKEYGAWLGVKRFIRLPLPELPEDNDFTKMEEKVFETYPMLRHARGGSGLEYVKNVVEYIALVDAK